ncbi:MAG TPA: DUF2480 family protein [Cyclobacteriaceae bacterium]|nr:DUF2480 family protein [Cyclobacteriaceae bacterium]HMV07508.1 DUF2480 family protein [Cyclobacteriaceae bacterium]HMV91783.1 DUF2480 family protein [Cyclobacteriaceae bacterium]HMX02784.1 DUF2480 family protein [Cyclobacteriaceae bacterium]HMX52093.1 DUF2480 family protein [Cyclobacteriaceae bacterium]
MAEEKEIINKVASSSLITFDLEEFYLPGDRVLIDLKDQLFQGMILREKDLRDFIKVNDWSAYRDKLVAITCSADAVIPTWAYMLITIALKPYAKAIEFGSLEKLEEKLFDDALEKVDWEQFRNSKIVVKGCSKVNVPASAYVKTVAKLQPLAASLMFGEACSTVPLFKRKSG